MCELALLGCLGICTIEDIKWHKIEQNKLLLFGVLGILLKCFSKRFNPMDMLLGFFIGVAAFVIAMLSKEQIGIGDALLLMISGIYLGFWGNVALLFLASSLAGINGVFLVLKNSANLRKKMAFVPYIMISYVIIMIIRVYEGSVL